MTWHSIGGTTPSWRTAPATAYDPKRNQVVYFGGHDGNGNKLNDTWIWNGDTAKWASHPATSPTVRSGAGMVYDPVHQNIVLFGGDGGYDGYLNDTWLWNGSNWTRVTPTTSPSARATVQMAWDGTQVVLFGGENKSTGSLNDTWLWDGEDWTKQTLTTSPPERQFSSMVYDGKGALLYGGAVLPSDTYRGDTWRWDGKTWTQINSTVTPSARGTGGMSFDGERIVMYGGTNLGGPLDETWIFNPQDDQWTQADPFVKPDKRGHTSLTYDGSGMILIGGFTNVGQPQGTWRYGEGSLPDVATDSASKDDNAGTVSVIASVDDNGGLQLTEVGVQYRKVGDSNWTTQAASSVIDGVNTVTLSSLRSNTAYEARAYATNPMGTSMGDIVPLPQLKGTPNIRLSATATAVTYGEPTTLSATISRDLGGPEPSGTVTFYSIDGTPLDAPVILTGGIGSYPLTGLDLGTHLYYAVYSGDTNYNPASNENSPLQVAVIQSDDSKLGSLTLRDGNGTAIALTPAFNPGLTEYEVQVPYGVTGVRLTAETQSEDVTFDINGDSAQSGVPSMEYALDLGDNEMTVHVVAQNGDELTYRVKIRVVDLPGAPTDVSAVAGDGQATIYFKAPAYDGGSPITGYEVISSPGNLVGTGTASPITVSGLTNGQAYTFTVRAINSTGPGLHSAVTNAVKPRKASTTGPEPTTRPESTTGSIGTPAQPDKSADMEGLVNGKTGKIGQVTTTKVDNRTVTTIAIDRERIQDMIAMEGPQTVLTIPAKVDSDVVIVELDGQTIRSMELKQTVIDVVTPYGGYTLPVQQINIQALSEQLGKGVDLQEVKVTIEVSKSSAGTVKLVENAAAQGHYVVVALPIDFTVKAVYGGQTIEVSKFNAYVERMIAIPDGVDPTRITTGVAIDPDGTVRHVPTQVIVIDGRYYAKINSLTNGTYSVIWNPYAFADTADHWAGSSINDLGSRLVVDGVGDDLFQPDRSITRAEFAAILLRGLGLKAETGSLPFTDVDTSDWYGGAIGSAYAYNLVNGFEDGTFRPLDSITREQAMTMIANAMSLTGLKSKLPNREANELLRPFADGDASSAWAIKGIADSLLAGVVSGRSGSELAPNDFISRAEVAVIVQRLLQKSELI